MIEQIGDRFLCGNSAELVLNAYVMLTKIERAPPTRVGTRFERKSIKWKVIVCSTCHVPSLYKSRKIAENDKGPVPHEK